MDLVPGGDWRGTVPDRGYLVADGDGGDDDLADPGSGSRQAGLGNAAVLRRGAGGSDAGRQAGSGRAGRPAGDPEAVAVDGAHDLGRSGPVCEAVLDGDT